MTCESHAGKTQITELDRNLYAIANPVETLDIQCPDSTAQILPLSEAGAHLIQLQCHCSIYSASGTRLISPHFPCARDDVENVVHHEIPGFWTKLQVHQSLTDFTHENLTDILDQQWHHHTKHLNLTASPTPVPITVDQIPYFNAVTHYTVLGGIMNLLLIVWVAWVTFMLIKPDWMTLTGMASIYLSAYIPPARAYSDDTHLAVELADDILLLLIWFTFVLFFITFFMRFGCRDTPQKAPPKTHRPAAPTPQVVYYQPKSTRAPAPHLTTRAQAQNSIQPPQSCVVTELQDDIIY